MNRLRMLVVGVTVLGACSDDGVPADEATASGSTGSGTSSDSIGEGTTQTTSVTSTSSSSGTTDSTVTADPTIDSSTATSVDTTGDGSTGPGGTETNSGTDVGTSDTSAGSSDSSSGESSSSDTGNAGLPTGAECQQDGDCSSGVCWDWNDYDELCGGTACSASCNNDDECVQLITDAGGKSPEESFCGKDGRCWMFGTGFGAYFCENG